MVVLCSQVVRMTLVRLCCLHHLLAFATGSFHIMTTLGTRTIATTTRRFFLDGQPQSTCRAPSTVAVAVVGGRPNDGTSDRNPKTEDILLELEKQVLASAQAHLDYNQVVQSLSLSDENDTRCRNFYDCRDDGDKDNENNNNNQKALRRNLTVGMDENKENGQLLNGPTSLEPIIRQTESLSSSSSWQIALAASTVSSVVVFGLFSNPYLSVLLFVVVFVVANVDPVDDDSELWGALARMVGRQTLHSYQGTIQPKARAVARAVVTGQEEVVALQRQIVLLEQENVQLRQWKRIRLQAEDQLSQYTVTELKDQCRQQGLPVGGKRTKLQLLVQLLEHKEEEEDDDKVGSII